MARQLALDWDEQQLRLVVGETTGRSVRITDAAIIPLGDSGLAATLRRAVAERGLAKLETLVAVGRDSAELRQMEFPPVPLAELPDMVRFQCIRTFASAGDAATVDYLPTEVIGSDGTVKNVRAIVSATGPTKLDPIRKAVDDAGLVLKRIALRPIAAAAFYQIADGGKSEGTSLSTMALIDLVGDEAEIVLFRGRDVSFVRSVKLPSEGTPRITALVGELRRSLIACGAGGEDCNVTIWGSAERHATELLAVSEKLSEGQNRDCRHRLLDPFDLVSVDDAARKSVGSTVGRLAPLVGLLVADAGHGELLIDFANPRKRVDEKPDWRKKAVIFGVPAAAVLLIAWTVWSQFSSLDADIAALQSANGELRTRVKSADASIAKTERIDRFLDGDVPWLEELERLAVAMPEAEKLILTNVSAISDPRAGGGTLTVTGVVTNPAVIAEFEDSLRDDSHRVIGDGASQLKTDDAYRWQMSESITIPPEAVREHRYERIAKLLEAGTMEISTEKQSTAPEQTSSVDSQNVSEVQP